MAMHWRIYEGILQYYTLFKVTLEDGSYEKYFLNDEKLDSLRTDIDGNVRVGVKIEKLKSSNQHQKTIWYRESLNEPMKKIHSRILGEDETFDIVALSDDNVHAYVISDRENARQALWSYNIKTNEFEKVLFSHPKYDVAGVIHNNEGKVVGIYYYDDYQHQYFFNQQQDSLTAVAQKLMPHAQLYIVSSSRDQKRFLFSAQTAEQVPVYYFVDLRNQKAGAWVASYPYLVKTKLSEPQKFEFKASDGMQLNGYLTMPHGAQKPPLIVFPHGGPTSRDTKYYNPFVQYFAAKGYAVMQVNFRGSEGFGNRYETSGYFEWGKRMQRDVDDATDFVKANYPISKDKSCLVGASYGGYVALTEAFQHPNKFNCYISIAGIADLKALVEHERRDDYFIKNIVQNEDSNTIDKLTEVSAAYHIERIKKPILLIHGTKDTQVDRRQSSDFYSKAKNKIDIKYVEIKNMTHHLDDAEGRMETFKSIDEFLDKYLQP
ncbi:alpha/beta hydrolase family protein [Shewanella sp.]|uniref:alpha/beta hydrolase family protein n=1 Tax=Shewanella sp. TaxID=50422 RepID=UPI003A97906E